MKVIEPRIDEIVYYPPEGMSFAEGIEGAGRTCYKSEDKITPGSAEKFVRLRRDGGHHAMLEFGGDIAIRFIADRGMTHELVRHRLASFAQESTRYCNYSKGKFEGQITVIKQPGLTEDQEDMWTEAMAYAEKFYLGLLDKGVKPEIARSVLPIGLKAEIVIKTNVREWRHILGLRCDKAAHPIIRGLMKQVMRTFLIEVPEVFDDLAELAN